MSLERARSWVEPYYPSFDGLRGIAILFVFLRHYSGLAGSWRLPQALWIGVDLFFVLSGFLITGILYDSVQDPHFFRTFYVRRSLRIFPLYFGLFGILYLLTGIFPGGGSNRSTLLFAAYIGNLVVPFLDLAKHPATVLQLLVHKHLVVIALGHLWSLCVEEQFYLIWPLIVFFIRDRRSLMKVALIVVLLTPVARSIAFFYAPTSLLKAGFLYGETFFRWDSLLVGAWCALWLRGATLTRDELRGKTYLWGVSAVLLALIGCAGTLSRWPQLFTNPFLTTIGFTAIAIAGGALVVHSVDSRSLLSRLLRVRALASLGSVSYGFYLFHELPKVPLEGFVQHHLRPHHLGWIALPILFAGIYLLAWLSFRFIERPILGLKRVLAPSWPAVPARTKEAGQPLSQALPAIVLQGEPTPFFTYRKTGTHGR